MPQETLKQQLKQLHSMLQQHPDLDDESRQLLQSIAADIANQPHDVQPEPGLNNQVQQQAIRFEQDHPALSEVLKQILDTLSRIGV
ncbi:DUF4404 family protein [Bacterioplanoides sp. SCSIO 12839]|uniref:DUF4404 family protein n=1 Tax=Bacterioplanoides sp. SCSIO 12839 TaxID=2829569 RepID=UPI002105476C|nr:DUF4404 family protein [Bacterioplanoides sp. SCSIO 12839]UTW47858.1 DUF4404 family protein [Bacterioplanoides sp. SCSIO 12839]